MHLVALVLCVFFQAPHPQAPPPLTAEPLVGVVVGEDGEPRAGVEVLLSSGSLPGSTGPVLGMALWTARARRPFADERPVLGRTRTDAAGRFQLNLPDEVVRSQEPLAIALWAYQEGRRVAFERLPWAIPGPAEPVRLVLGALAPAAFRIVGPDGMPDVGARLGAAVVGLAVVPAELTALLGATAGDDGVAVVHAFAADQISAVWIDSPRFGRQKVQVSPAAGAEARLVKLEPSGRIVGRVVTNENVPVVGLRLRARTTLAGSDAPEACGWAEATTDRDGGFTIPAIAAGRLVLTLDFRSRPDLPYRGLPPVNLVAEPGQTATVPIRLTRAVQLDGLIRERGTGLPIAGVSPEIPDPASRVGGNPPVVTDARGRFAGCMEHDQPYAFIYATPRPYFVPADASDDFHLLPAGATKFTLPPTELVRGVALRGSVVDDAGNGVAGALVRASWASKNVAHQSVATRASAGGAFLLEGVDPLADLDLKAEGDGVASAPGASARADAGKPVTLIVSRANTVVLSGRVVDTTGKPIAGAEVRVRAQARDADGRVWRIDAVVFANRDTLHTDAEGRYRTPSGLPRNGEYEASVTARGMLSNRTIWLKPGTKDRAAFDDLTVRHLRAVQGVVHDRQGRPVVGAVVFQSGDGPIRTRTVTDARGHFQLAGVIDGPAILFARTDGFRFHGKPIAASDTNVELVLTRADEDQPALATLPSVLPRSEELALARRLLAPYVEKVVQKGTDLQKFRALVALAPIDPAGSLELIDSKGAGKPMVALDNLRSLIATGIAEVSADEAVSVAETLTDATTRSWCLVDIFDKMPAGDRSRRVELLAQAQLHAGTIEKPAGKLRVLGRIADRWLDLNETDRAQILLREGRELVKKVPPPGYEIVSLAEPLSRVDLSGALALIDTARETAKRGDRVNRAFVFERSCGEIAYRLAGRDPAGAERALGQIGNAYRRGSYLAAACVRMASIDLPRAIRLAKLIDDPLHRAYALGLMARSVAAADKTAAAHLLEESFDQLEQYRDDRHTLSSAPAVAAALLPVVEQLAPSRLQESVWRAVSLRPPMYDERTPGTVGRAEADLAMSLARYDRAAAAAVLAPALAAFAATDIDTHRQGFIAAALVLIDPRRAVSLVEEMPDDPNLDDALPKNAARALAAGMLGKHGDARWNYCRSWAVSLWRPEGSDL